MGVPRVVCRETRRAETRAVRGILVTSATHFYAGGQSCACGSESMVWRWFWERWRPRWAGLRRCTRILITSMGTAETTSGRDSAPSARRPTVRRQRFRKALTRPRMRTRSWWRHLSRQMSTPERATRTLTSAAGGSPCAVTATTPTTASSTVTRFLRRRIVEAFISRAGRRQSR